MEHQDSWSASRTVSCTNISKKQLITEEAKTLDLAFINEEDIVKSIGIKSPFGKAIIVD